MTDLRERKSPAATGLSQNDFQRPDLTDASEHLQATPPPFEFPTMEAYASDSSYTSDLEYDQDARYNQHENQNLASGDDLSPPPEYDFGPPPPLARLGVFDKGNPALAKFAAKTAARDADESDSDSCDVLIDDSANANSLDSPAKPSLRLVDLSDVMTAPFELVRFAIHPWFPRRHATLFGGHGGIGKTSLALAIAAHVACGTSFAGHEVERSLVVFLSLEDEPSIVRLRLRRIIESYGLPPELVLENLRLLDGTRTFAALMTEGDGFNSAPEFTKAFGELARQAPGAGLIIIDNASDAFDANENHRRSVRTFVRSLALLARANDAAVVLLAHIDKASAKNGAQGNSYSGSTAWHNTARSRLALVEQEGRIVLLHEKANLTALAEPLPITFIDGVPVPESGANSNGLTSEDFDQAEIVQAMKAAHDTGINVPGNITPGAHSAMKALEALPEYGKTFRGKAGGQRAARAFAALLRKGRITRIDYIKANRHKAERLVLFGYETPTQLANAEPICALSDEQKSASRHPPTTPQRSSAAPIVACVNAPILNDADPSTIDAIDATLRSSNITEGAAP